eukprot:211116-Amorphochlora_amoeboformis.AAC.1
MATLFEDKRVPNLSTPETQTPKATALHHLEKTKRKKSRDPNAPKRASNAYMIFCKSRRSQPPQLLVIPRAKLGEIWRDLRPDEKRPFEEQAARDRQRYKKEMKEYPGAAEYKNKKRVLPT